MLVAACAAGAALGALNGALVAYLRLPSIVVTLATMVALRDGLRWTTQGAWVQDLPPGFQWLGLSQAAYPVVALLVAAGAAGGHGLGRRGTSRPAAPFTRPDRTRTPRGWRASTRRWSSAPCSPPPAR